MGFLWRVVLTLWLACLSISLIGQGVMPKTAGKESKPVARPKPYDGYWWQAATREQQIGFLAGEDDCYAFDRRCPERSYRTNDEALAWLNEFYDKQPQNLSLPVREALRKVRVPYSPSPPSGEGQAHREAHGYYDGLWWKGSGPDGRVGFIEGYLACLPNREKLFPNAPAKYVQLIDTWYKTHSEDEKIAVVLRLVAKTKVK
jgi:hypothetical protein